MYFLIAVEELQCLATWKEGSYRYLVGLMQYRHHASYEERFRCFVYEKVKKGSIGIGLGGYSNTMVRSSPLTFNSTSSSPSLSSSEASSSNQNAVLFRVSQSGDASCQGLSGFEGSRVMTFRRGKQPSQRVQSKSCTVYKCSNEREGREWWMSFWTGKWLVWWVRYVILFCVFFSKGRKSYRVYTQNMKNVFCRLVGLL